MNYLGKLPAIGLYKAVHIFKCQSCMTARSIDLGADVPKEAVVL